MFTQKGGAVYCYDLGQESLYQKRINDEGHVSITKEEADLLLAPPEAPITAQGLKSIVTRYRWEVETSGITLQDGTKVATGLDDQNRITTVVANARFAGLEQVKFKALAGFVTLTLAEVEAIAAGVALHVQACFAAECDHYEAIDALAAQHANDPVALQEVLDAYDETAGWPDTQPAPTPAL